VSVFRIASLPLLHRGNRLRNSPAFWIFFLAFVLLGLVIFKAQPIAYLIAVFPLAAIMFCISARVARSKGVSALSAHRCPCCDNKIGDHTASAGFGAYTRSCNQFIQRAQSEDAFSIDLAPPLTLVCPKCDAYLFFDYLDSLSLTSIENEEAEPQR